MKNVTDRPDRARHLWGAAKFPRESGAPNTTAPRADAQVMTLICGDTVGGQASGHQSRVQPQKVSTHGFPVKQITVNRVVEKAPLIGLAAGGH